ncbi:acetyl/propionyl/methylcrotonyl-CoA carboxylase subunit alpha [Xylanimonas sp. McL0601]|uniref:acetyl/propionyl/methylcrotonyl-CoA carboxylase subunit alpha n=1 Tax=Xylanimonas sp. McL0601 TaxID=3414739 RepID=UPI003CEF3919
MSAVDLSTVLVANRGEIACRVIATLRRLGLRSVAVHTAADADARHVREADVAVRLSRAPTGASPRAAYLDVDAVVGAAAAAGADAVHPGYGFLSESPALARACERAGLTFVGPPVAALELMADKLAAKRLVGARGVPVLPGTLDGEALAAGTPADKLLATARDVGLPLLVKPAAGGGGKGMVVVRTLDELPAALDSARRVAAASFGDDTLLLERLVDRPRHVEVQVIADVHGGVVHLGERECTLQRRYQKVVEEAPSPAIGDATRARLGEAACEVARSVGYVGAGTVEFLVPADDPASFWFIEMNTRLQVEHPVTELVTGLDLVELQLRAAGGEPLGFGQSDVRTTGHAVEARLYAEAPARGFLPATGAVLVYDDAGVPAGPGAAPLRLDSGIAEGTAVTGDFDPLLAKAVAHGADRAQALDRLDTLLASVVVLGVETNQSFLRDLLADEDVRAGRLDTGLIDRMVGDLSGPGRDRARPGPDNPAALLVAAALATLDGDRPGMVDRPGTVPGTVSAAGPWAARDGWRLNGVPAPRRVVLLDDAGAEHAVLVTGSPADAMVTLDAEPPVAASWRPAGRPHAWLLTLGGVTRTFHAAHAPAESGRSARAPRSDEADVMPAAVWVGADGRSSRFGVLDRAQQAARRRTPRAPDSPDGEAPGEVRAAMPGTVTAVPVADGDAVEPGATVVVVEAMKMEHALAAPRGGTVRLRVRPGDLVRLDQVVAVVENATQDGAADPAAPVTHSATRGAS